MASGGELRNIIKSAFKFRRIPDKWKDYAPCGNPIDGERLISFKTPLSEDYHYTGEGDADDSLQHGEEFTPRNLCDTLRKKGNELGLVVDFTNTTRYYNPKVFTSDGIEYKKIKCEGKIVPPEKVVNQCKAAILSFFQRFPSSNSLIGLHCTHGLNRAGYIVCRYLIDCKGYIPDDAIKAFNKARGYDMERENYLNDLRERTPNLLSDVDVGELLKYAPTSEEGKPGNYRSEIPHRNGGPIQSRKRRQYDCNPYPSRRPDRKHEETQDDQRRLYSNRSWNSSGRARNDYSNYHENRSDYWNNGWDRGLPCYQESPNSRRHQRYWKPQRYQDDLEPEDERRPSSQLKRRNDSQRYRQPKSDHYYN